MKQKKTMTVAYEMIMKKGAARPRNCRCRKNDKGVMMGERATSGVRASIAPRGMPFHDLMNEAPIFPET